MRKTVVVLFIFLFLLGNLFVLMSFSAEGGIKLWPSKLTINVSEYPEEEIQYKLQVTNPNNYDINVVAEIVNPSPDDINEGYSYIPDLSWVKISPDILSIPANSYDYFTLSVSIPESEKPLHYNESWEIWARVYKKTKGEVGNVVINVKLASKIFIHTPSGPAKQQYNPYILLLIIVGFIAAATFVFYAKNRERITYKKRPAILYFKKKKEDGSRNNRP